MGLTVESIGQQSSVCANSAMVRPEAYDDMELSELLSGSGSFKTKNGDDMSKLSNSKEEKEKAERRQKAGDIILDCIPSILSAGVAFKFSQNPLILLTCVVSNLATIAIKMMKDKRVKAAAAA